MTSGDLLVLALVLLGGTFPLAGYLFVVAIRDLFPRRDRGKR